MNLLLSIDDVKQLQAVKSKCVILLCGETASSEPGYAYLLLHTHKLNQISDLLEDDEQTGTIDLNEIGEVLEHGTGIPAQEVQQKMFDEWAFGFSHTNIRFFPEGER